MPRFVVVGTNHVARQSRQLIGAACEAHQPAAVAVELDAARLSALLAPPRRPNPVAVMRQVGVFGGLFLLIGSALQSWVGRLTGVSPGDEFRVALQEARRRNIPVALIDRPLAVTARRLTARMGWRERGRLVGDLVLGRGPRARIALEKVPSQAVIEELLAWIRSRYPGLAAVLLDERNAYMVRALRQLAGQVDGTIVVVVGAAHATDIERRLVRMGADGQRPASS